MNEPAAPRRPGEPAARLDVRDVACPLTWVRTHVALSRLAEGEALEVVLLAGEPLENVPRTAEEEGHRVVARERWPAGGEGAWRIVVVKGQPRGEGWLP
ncbi:MAG TPA: sulfurtransferase TusA family protein [Anaeromyxobacteraceae bacterium]|nr:sulfurtransferase TusA family protein [Anaeromyxobacteraceae bacterium]